MATTSPLLPSLPFIPNPSRHDEEPPAPVPVPEPAPAPAPEPEPAPEPKKPAAPPQKTPKGSESDDKPPRHVPVEELAQEREARKAAAAEAKKAREELDAAQRKIQEFEDAQKSELEKAQAAAERAAAREKAANLRAVTSDIRSAAIAAEAVRPADVVDLLTRDPEKYITDSGIDAEAIEAAVTAALAERPHWVKQAAPDPVKAPAKPAPKPDPSQGPQPTSSVKDFTDPKVLADEAARFGIRLTH